MGMFLRAKYPCICSEAGTARHRMGRQHAARVQVLEEAVSRGGAKTFEPNQIIVGMNSYAPHNPQASSSSSLISSLELSDTQVYEP